MSACPSGRQMIPDFMALGPRQKISIPPIINYE